MTLRPEQRFTAEGRKLAEREIEIGDQGFDDEVLVLGAPERVRALLDVDTRRVVRKMLRGAIEAPGKRAVLVHGHAALIEGNLQLDVAEQPRQPTAGEIVPAVEALLALAERFRLRPADAPARLVSHLESEPEWRVRLNGIELLASSFPQLAETQLALRRALADEQPEVRLRAAIALGTEGLPVLREVACGEGDDATIAHAIDVLAERLPADEALLRLRHALRSRRVHTADACIQRLARAGGGEAVEVLCKIVAVERGPLAVAATQALGKLGASAAEEPLVAALGLDVPGLRLAAISALGRLGSALAVLPIREAATDGDADTRHAARQAVDAIQARLRGASPGQLSLAEGEAGQISLAEAEAGRVSLADEDPRGRLSLPTNGAEQ